MPQACKDWWKVVVLAPHGYAEFCDGSRVIHGPVDEISIDEATDMVTIQLKWQAVLPLKNGMPTSAEWRVNDANDSIDFPNFTVPFKIEDTPEKGRRVRSGLNIIYLTEEGFGPERVEGLVVDDGGRQIVPIIASN